MNKIKYLSAFLLLFTAFNFISCEDIEPIDSTIVLNPDQGCVSPTSFRASDFVNGTNINLNWVAGGEEESWEIQYGISGFTVGNGTSIFSESTNLTIANLISTNSYQFYVRSNCSENEVSAWVGPISVNSSTGGNCLTPASLAAIRPVATPTQINLNWTSPGTATSWQVQYGATGFSLGSGTTVTVNTNSAQIQNLVATTSYDFYVRTVCSATEFSNWTAVATVLGSGTPPVGVTYAFMGANVYNVMHNNMKPLLYGFTPGVKIEYFDGSVDPYLKLQGDSSQTPSTPGSFEINIRIPKSQWQPGTYQLQGYFDVINDGNNSYVHFIQFPADGRAVLADISNGTITITEFNRVTRRIRGTFSYSYTNSYDTGTEGPFQVTNGTFDYPLDASYFN